VERSTKDRLGFEPGCRDGMSVDERRRLVEYLNVKLAARGLPIYGNVEDYPYLEMSKSLLTSVQQKNKLLADYLCPADQYVSDFLDDYLGEFKDDKAWLPTGALTLEKHGLSRMLSLPPDRDWFKSDIIASYRVQQGICHNPKHDRRTTKGVFHICEGGYAVPADKKEVPKIAFAGLLRRALKPPAELMRLPFTATQKKKAKTFVSIMLRPLVCPEVPGVLGEKRMETRFFVPGNLVANLDFVESIFGNAGDPYLAENDARLDVEHWSGHTGCVILAPHLIRVKKKSLGLPHISDATERQKKDGMCWEQEDEIYNDGGAFKVTLRNHKGVVVTLIADNYFGYCKKEVKTQLSYAANLMGICEEEHAGGALAFPRYDLGESFRLNDYRHEVNHTFKEAVKQFGDVMELQPEGYGIDKQYRDIYYVPEDVHIQLREQTVSWTTDKGPQQIKLLPNISYVLPFGYKIEMVKPMKGLRWRLMGTSAEGTFCHKPCTVSGGGKSEISKPLTDVMIAGPIVTHNFKRDFEMVKEIIARDFSDRYEEPTVPGKTSRPLLSEERSLGSVVKLLTPNPEYTLEYNSWVSKIPRHVRDLVLLVKRFHKPNWEEDWLHRFSVDNINGMPGNELKYWRQPLTTLYQRIGFTADGAWRTYSLRKDFWTATKLQTEDDISVSAVVPTKSVAQHLHEDVEPLAPAMKFVENCEFRLFQRPDEAIVRGHDKTAEADFGKRDNFFSNYEPLSRQYANDMIQDSIAFDMFTEPMQQIIKSFVSSESPDFLMSTSHPRIFDGTPTKNPRYLQNRPDLDDQRPHYVAHIGARLRRRIPLDQAVPFPVNSVLPGRRNNPPDYEKGIRPLAVYGPIHYQELPELFMEFVASLTGKSPSTTGAGSEGALTKGPFNMMPAIIDLNTALVSYILCGHHGFSSAAGYIGPNYRVDHDVSLLVPELWSRMYIHERDPQYLIKNRLLEVVKDFEHKGQKVLGSRLGYRITKKFSTQFLGRIFSSPDRVFDRDMLKPERQGMDAYVDGINNIVETQQRVALAYFEDGTIDLACPPLKALLHIMAHGDYEGKEASAPEIREMFSREYLVASDWYAARLESHKQVELAHCSKLIDYLRATLKEADETEADVLEAKLKSVQKQRDSIRRKDAQKAYMHTLGTDPAILAIS
jgi:phosphoenolpyruvate carboxykinase (diphosphate)